MFRWRVMAFRLLLFGLFLAACWMTAKAWTPLAVRQVARQAFGSVMDFDTCQVDWGTRCVELTGVAIPDSEDPLRNLVTGASLRAHFDAQSMLSPQWVLTRAEIHDVGLGTPRDKLASDRFNGVRSAWRTVEPEAVKYDLTAAAKRWMNKIQSGPPIRLQDSEEFQAISKEIRQTWQREFESQRLELSRLRQDLESATSQMRADNPNPLRSAERNREIQAKLSELRPRYEAVREWLRNWQQDHASAVERLRDVRVDSRNAPGSVSFGSDVTEAAAAMLVSEVDVHTCRRILAWVGELQRRLEAVEALSAEAPSRGHNVLVPGMSPQPKMFIQELSFDGACHLEGDRIQFEGLCRNLSNRPELAEIPIEFHLKGHGREHFHIDGFLDRRASEPLTEFRFSWLPMEAPKTELGTASSALLSLTPHRSQTDATIRIKDEKLEGTITCYHSQAGMMITALNEIAGGQEVLDKLNGQLGTIQQVEVVASVSGTLHYPIITFDSDLAEPFTAALSRCINLQLEENQNRNRLALDRVFDSTLEELKEMAARELLDLERVMQSHQLRLSELEKHLPDAGIRQVR